MLFAFGIFPLREVDTLVRCEIFKREALEAMLLGMDCLAQEVHVTLDVFESENWRRIQKMFSDWS